MMTGGSSVKQIIVRLRQLCPQHDLVAACGSSSVTCATHCARPRMDSLLLEAVTSGDTATVSSLLRAGAPVKAGKAASAVHLAAQSSGIILRLLLEYDSAAVDTIDRNKQTPMHFAARAGSTECVSQLVAANSLVKHWLLAMYDWLRLLTGTVGFG